MKSLLTYYKQQIQNNPTRFIIANLVFTIVVCFICLFLGATRLTLADLFSLNDIFIYVRIPRILAGIVSGIGFVAAGFVIQTLLANPLAGPNIIGVNSGAGLFTILCSVLFPTLPFLLPVASFLGAIVAVTIIFFIATKIGASKQTLVLTGVVTNSIFASLSEAVYTLIPTSLIALTTFRVGGLAYIQNNVLFVSSIFIFVSVFVLLLKRNTIEILSLGDDVAKGLGVNVFKERTILLLLCASCIGGAVSFAGLIGFIGLVVPHFARLVVGNEFKQSFLLSIIWGPLLMVVCDTMARVLFAPFELPVGIVLSLFGAPIFILLLFTKKARV